MEKHTASGDSKTLPYVSYATFHNALGALVEHGLPPAIDKSVLNKFSGANQNLILSTLRFLGFTDAHDIPQEIFHSYQKAEPEKRKGILGLSIKENYPSQTKILAAATYLQLKDSFNNSNVKPSVKAKCLSFFLGAAKASGYSISNYIQKGLRERVPRKDSGPRKKKAPSGQKSTNKIIEDPEDPVIPEGMVSVPISIGVGRTWSVTIDENYTQEDFERFIQMAQIALKK